ncbi:mannitol operon repressor [Desulfosarcina variabilis str. Montpellier]|uniref:MltR family transcriptional regulator n=1 Tax=Desulfosarcina variabilis TaxID=2300 RepID=UPI003AFB0D95
MKKYVFDIKRETNFIKEINEQSDRGAALIVATWLDEELRAAIKTKFVNSDSNEKKVFEGNGPLSTFSSKIEIGYSLGLLSKQAYSDLTIIRKIRNDFAHSILGENSEAVSFKSKHIRDRCYSLKRVEDEEFDSPRHSFLRNCAAIWADINFIVWAEKAT